MRLVGVQEQIAAETNVFEVQFEEIFTSTACQAEQKVSEV